MTLQQLLDFQLKKTAGAALPIFRYLLSGQELSYDAMYLQKNLHHCVTKSGPDNALVQVQMQVHDIVAIWCLQCGLRAETEFNSVLERPNHVLHV